MVVIEGTGGPPAEWEQRAPHVRMREWIESTRRVAGRIPKRYDTLEDAYRRMHDENSHLREDQARHLTLHGANQNEDGSYSWKFDNYTHCMAAYDMPREQVRELWGRVDAPVLLIKGSESWFNDPARQDPLPYFQNAREVLIEDAGHWLHHDQLDQFLSITREFLAE